jgi:hypothetical protein
VFAGIHKLTVQRGQLLQQPIHPSAWKGCVAHVLPQGREGYLGKGAPQ